MATSMLSEMFRRAVLVQPWRKSPRFLVRCSLPPHVASANFNSPACSATTAWRPTHGRPSGFHGFIISRRPSPINPIPPSSAGYASGSNPYYVLLPEVPPDTSETNPIMRLHDHPQFSRIHPDGTITGCAKLAIEFDVEMERHVEGLKDGSKEKTFEAVFDPIERLVVPLNYAWRTTKNLNYTCSPVGFRAAFTRVHPQVERAKNARWVDHGLYHAVKEVSAERARLTDPQRRLVDMYLLEARLNGIDLTGADKKHFTQVLASLVQAKGQFRNRVALAHNLFSHTVHDPAEVAEMPPALLRELTPVAAGAGGSAGGAGDPGRGPWRVTLNRGPYEAYLQHCPHRTSRWNVWQAYNNRASISQDEQNLSNHLLIEMIREHRRDLARLLGYACYADMSMETKMAGGLKRVVETLAELRDALKPAAEAELQRLETFARAEGFSADRHLQMWDVPYYRRRQRDRLHGYDPAEVAQSLPYPGVLSFLFQLVQRFFGVIVTEATEKVETWHPSVSFYKVTDAVDGRHIASFYVDPYARPSAKLPGSWMETGREHSGVLGTAPFSYLSLSLPPPPSSSAPTLMTVEQVETLFHEFGHGMQQMLTTAPYSEIAGQRNIEWDSLQTCAKLFSLFARHPRTLHALAASCGRPLPPDTVQRVVASRAHMAATDACRQVYLSALDLELYVSTEHWQRVVPRLWAQYATLPPSDDDNHLCSMTAIFSDQYAAAYYSIIWAEVLAAEIFGAFDVAGFGDAVEGKGGEEAMRVGRRFRETYLELGGGVAAAEVFRRFMAREPSVGAFIATLTRGR